MPAKAFSPDLGTACDKTSDKGCDRWEAFVANLFKGVHCFTPLYALQDRKVMQQFGIKGKMHIVWGERQQPPIVFAGSKVETHLVEQAGLHREGLIQELLVEGLLGVMHHDDSYPLPIILGPPCPTHHLEHICYGKVHITPAHTSTQSAPEVVMQTYVSTDVICAHTSTQPLERTP